MSNKYKNHFCIGYKGNKNRTTTHLIINNKNIK